MYYNKKHKMEINKRLKEYAYIGSYDKKEITIDNKNKTKTIIILELNVFIVEKNMILDSLLLKRGESVLIVVILMKILLLIIFNKN